jgi:hypothetical protein
MICEKVEFTHRKDRKGSRCSDCTHFVIIPLIIDRGLGEETLHFIISEIVLPVGSELIKSYSNKVLRWIIGPCADVLATFSICDVFTGLDGVICIDHITFECWRRRKQ